MLRNVRHISPFYVDLGLAFQPRLSQCVLEQVDSHYDNHDVHVGTLGLLLEYMGDTPNL